MKYALRSLTGATHICPGGFLASPAEGGTTHDLTDAELAAVKADKRVAIAKAPEAEPTDAELNDGPKVADLPPPEGNGPSSPNSGETTPAPKKR